MPVYEIIPETSIKKNDLGIPIKNVGISVCRKKCDQKENCEAFVWNSGEGTEEGVSKCTLKTKSDGDTVWDVYSTLYIKKGNPSYWWLWSFLAILGILVFLLLCKGFK